ncbi:MAG: hypothetical protein ABI664_01780, partial [bacterium]
MLTLTFVAILVVALLAPLSGSATSKERGALARMLDSRGIVVFVFVVTFVVIWFAWASWNPIPVVHDEMAYVLQAEIFARGKWALPSPPIPAFWEQPHVLVEPTLASKYFPGHSLVMALGALVGWLPLMPLVLQSTVGALLFVLARRVASGAVAFLAWSLWLMTPITLYFGASYFSEATTTVCWLAGWYALLEWRSTGALRWLLAVALFTGWCAITRPLTGVAYAIPVGIVVLHDVVAGRRWRDFAFALAMGVAVVGILPVWNAHATGDWRLTPQTLYTRMYMPYDVPGFGLVTTRSTRSISPQLARLNESYSSVHVNHFPSTLPRTFVSRAMYLSASIWGVTSGVLGIFALLGLLTLGRETAFATCSGVVLFLTYLLYATPPQWTLYYYESIPAWAYLSAAGMAWAAAQAGRPRAMPMSPTFSWRSPRWSRALVAGALVLAVAGLGAARMLRTQHRTDREKLLRFHALLETIHDRRAVVFVRFSPAHDAHVAFVRNVADLTDERIWVVYDRGESENAKLLSHAPERKAYLFDELHGRTYIY